MKCREVSGVQEGQWSVGAQSEYGVYHGSRVWSVGESIYGVYGSSQVKSMECRGVHGV